MSSDTPASTRVTLLQRLNHDPSDELSWAEFVKLYTPAILGWLRHWGLQEADAQDVAQNVLLRLTRKLPQFEYDPRRRFRGWLRTLTHHAWCDFVTETGYHHRGSGDTQVFERLRSVEARDDLAARIAAEFDREVLETAMIRARQRVTAANWDAFRLVTFEGLSPQAVAEKLGLRVSQVYLARHRVQKIVQEEVRAIEKTLR